MQAALLLGLILQAAPAAVEGPRPLISGVRTCRPNGELYVERGELLPRDGGYLDADSQTRILSQTRVAITQFDRDCAACHGLDDFLPCDAGEVRRSIASPSHPRTPRLIDADQLVVFVQAFFRREIEVQDRDWNDVFGLKRSGSE